MSKFLLDLTNPYWWLSVVVVGIGVNIISPLISKVTGRLWGKWSEKRRAKIEEKKEFGERLVHALSMSHPQQNFYQAKIQNIYFTSTRSFMFGGFMIACGFFQTFISSSSGLEGPFLALFFGTAALFFIDSGRKYIQAQDMFTILTRAMTQHLKNRSEDLKKVEQLMKKPNISLAEVEKLKQKLEEIERR